MTAERGGRATVPIVLVENLSVWFPSHYGDVPIIDNVSLTIGRGETFGLVGESGSGKTLLAQSILGLLPRTVRVSGRIVVNGIDVLGAPERSLSRIRGAVAAPVFQDALVSLSPNRTVGGHFKDVWKSSGMTPRDGWRHAAEAALTQVALPQISRVLDSYPHELSGGMRQRVLIALALLRHPTLLIADEPTTALDRVVEVEVLWTLRRLQRDLGLSMVLVSHDLEVVSRICDRIAVLYAGQLCELGPTRHVVENHLHRYTAGLIASVRSLEQIARPLRTIPGVVPPPSDFGPGCRFLPRCPMGGPECTEKRPRAVVGATEVWCHHPDCEPVGTFIGRKGSPRGRGGAITRIASPSARSGSGPRRPNRVSAPEGTPLMEVVRVSKTYSAKGERVRALREVSLEVRPGEVVSVVGESGSGKSTLARIMVGLESPDSGEILLNGEPVGIKRTRTQRRQVQIVFQDPRSSLNPRMSILASVEDFAAIHGLGDRTERRRLAVAALESVHLSEAIASRRPPELSGGQLQRACLARALVTGPSLLVLDEPTSSLDVSIQGQILNVLDELRSRVAMVLISHDMAVIRFMSDRVYVMLDGRVVESGRTEQIMECPEHEYTRRLIRASLPKAVDA